MNCNEKYHVLKGLYSVFQSLIGILMNCNGAGSSYNTTTFSVSIPNRDFDELQLELSSEYINEDGVSIPNRDFDELQFTPNL